MKVTREKDELGVFQQRCRMIGNLSDWMGQWRTTGSSAKRIATGDDYSQFLYLAIPALHSLSLKDTVSAALVTVFDRSLVIEQALRARTMDEAAIDALDIDLKDFINAFRKAFEIEEGASDKYKQSMNFPNFHLMSHFVESVRLVAAPTYLSSAASNRGLEIYRHASRRCAHSADYSKNMEQMSRTVFMFSMMSSILPQICIDFLGLRSLIGHIPYSTPITYPITERSIAVSHALPYIHFTKHNRHLNKDAVSYLEKFRQVFLGEKETIAENELWYLPSVSISEGRGSNLREQHPKGCCDFSAIRWRSPSEFSSPYC
jgi:hypothetical protein